MPAGDAGVGEESSTYSSPSSSLDSMPAGDAGVEEESSTYIPPPPPLDNMPAGDAGVGEESSTDTSSSRPDYPTIQELLAREARDQLKAKQGGHGKS